MISWKNIWVLQYWVYKKPAVYAIYDDFGNFPIFKFCPIWAGQKIFKSHFAFWTKIWPKNIYQTTQTQYFQFDLYDLVTLDDPDLTKGHKSRKRVLRIVPDTIDVLPSALFQDDMAALPSEARNDRYSKFDIWPDLWRHQWRSVKNWQHIKKGQVRS